MPQACKQCGTVAGTVAGTLCPACLLRLASLPESRVPDFEIETLLGSGTGTTHLARAADGTLLAVKTVGPAGDREAIEDLDAALRAAEHPHLARTIGVAVGDDGETRLVRAFVPGRALLEWLPSASPAARAEARQALAGALAALHEAGIAHGHVCASNVVIGAGSRAILLDAGARAAIAGGEPDVRNAQRRDLMGLDALFQNGGAERPFPGALR